MIIKNCNYYNYECSCEAIPMELCPFKKLIFDVLNGKTGKEILKNIDYELGENDVFYS